MFTELVVSVKFIVSPAPSCAPLPFSKVAERVIVSPAFADDGAVKAIWVFVGITSDTFAQTDPPWLDLQFPDVVTVSVVVFCDGGTGPPA